MKACDMTFDEHTGLLGSPDKKKIVQDKNEGANGKSPMDLRASQIEV